MKYTDEVIQYLHDHWHVDMSPKEIAAHFGTTPQNLTARVAELRLLGHKFRYKRNRELSLEELEKRTRRTYRQERAYKALIKQRREEEAAAKVVRKTESEEEQKARGYRYVKTAKGTYVFTNK